MAAATWVCAALTAVAASSGPPTPAGVAATSVCARLVGSNSTIGVASGGGGLVGMIATMVVMPGC